MSKRYEIIQTSVPHENTPDTGYARTTKLSQRLDDINAFARRGYEVRHTHVFQHDGAEIYVDDLEKDLDAPL